MKRTSKPETAAPANPATTAQLTRASMDTKDDKPDAARDGQSKGRSSRHDFGTPDSGPDNPTTQEDGDETDKIINPF